MDKYEPFDLDAFVEFERQEKEIAERYKKRQDAVTR